MTKKSFKQFIKVTRETVCYSPRFEVPTWAQKPCIQHYDKSQTRWSISLLASFPIAKYICSLNASWHILLQKIYLLPAKKHPIVLHNDYIQLNNSYKVGRPLCYIFCCHMSSISFSSLASVHDYFFEFQKSFANTIFNKNGCK